MKCRKLLQRENPSLHIFRALFFWTRLFALKAAVDASKDSFAQLHAGCWSELWTSGSSIGNMLENIFYFQHMLRFWNMKCTKVWGSLLQLLSQVTNLIIILPSHSSSLNFFYKWNVNRIHSRYYKTTLNLFKLYQNFLPFFLALWESSFTTVVEYVVSGVITIQSSGANSAAGIELITFSLKTALN